MNQEAGPEDIFSSFFRTAKSRFNHAAVIEASVISTYSQLLDRTAEMVRMIPEKGSERAVKVGILLPNGRDYAACFLAAVSKAGVAVLLNPRMSSRELSWYDRELNLDILFTNRFLAENLAAKANALSGRTIQVEEIPPAPFSGTILMPLPRISRDAMAIFVGTSGTTGEPKIVMRTHGQLIANVSAIQEALQVGQSDCFSGVVPFCHSYGISCGMLMPLLSGGTMVPQSRFLPMELAAACRECRITVLIASPMILAMLSESTATAADFSSVRVSLSSGARLALPLHNDCRERLGLKIRQLYGSSEMGTVAIAQADDPEDPNCAGKALENVEIRIDEEGAEKSFSPGVGEVLVRSPALMAGYFEHRGRQVKAFDDGFFRSGDIGRIDEEGRLYLKGRIKRMINVCGMKVDPVEIKIVLEEIPGVRKASVAGLPGKHGMEIISAVLHVEPGSKIGRTKVVGFCRGRLAEYKIPRVISFFDGADPLGKMH